MSMKSNASDNSFVDEDEDYDVYNNPAAYFNKIKEQKVKESAMKIKQLEEVLAREDNVEKTQPESAENSSTVLDTIEITDSNSPEPSSFVVEEESPSYGRGQRRSMRTRGINANTSSLDLPKRKANSNRTALDLPKRKANSNSTALDLPKRKGRKTSIDKNFENLVKVAQGAKLNASRFHSSSNILNDPPILLDSDEDDTDEIVNVKVLWRHGAAHSFPILRSKDIGVIFEFFAKQENVDIKNILLSKKDKVLPPHSTPLSIGYKVTDILEGGILHDDVVKQNTRSKQPDKNCIEVKVQQKNVKKALLVQLHKSNDMHILAKKVASALGIDVSKLKFTFDGDLLDLDDTVETLDLEGGECFDLAVSS